MSADALTNPRFTGDPHLEQVILGYELMAWGWHGCAVERVQIALEDLGFPLPGYGSDGSFGQETYDAVCAFQSANSLVSDGTVGPLTLRALDELATMSPSRIPECAGGPPRAGRTVGPGPTGQGAGTHRLHVYVVDGHGNHEAGVHVQVSGPEERYGQTLSAGIATFTDLPDGTYEVTAWTEELAAVSATAEIDGASARVDLTLDVRQGRSPAFFAYHQVSAWGDAETYITTPFDLPWRESKVEGARNEAIARAHAAVPAAVEAERERHQAEHPELYVVSTLIEGSERVHVSEGSETVDTSFDEAGQFTIVSQTSREWFTASVTVTVECRSE